MRNVIRNLFPLAAGREPHGGLLFDQSLRSCDSADTDAKRTLIRQVASNQTPVVYKSFLRRWQEALALMPDTEVRPAHGKGRLVMGLGGESILETGLTFHRTYGVPYLPGSALKGLAASYARQRLSLADWGPTSEAYRVLFGDTDASGYVTFHDALPWLAPKGTTIEAPFSELKLHPDVMTVHHADYYMKGVKPPADWDSPTPVPYLSFSGTFLIALSGPDAWRQTAFDILRLALAEYGIGAKTSSGYGRLALAKK